MFGDLQRKGVCPARKNGAAEDKGEKDKPVGQKLTPFWWLWLCKKEKQKDDLGDFRPPTGGGEKKTESPLSESGEHTGGDRHKVFFVKAGEACGPENSPTRKRKVPPRCHLYGGCWGGGEKKKEGMGLSKGKK